MSFQVPEKAEKSAFCRSCLADVRAAAGACAACGSARIARHAELYDLAVAHLDCDAFYAAIEKRDDPALADRPVIVGGGTRGVVSTCCYIARTYGVRSAMPMFQALKACPQAVVIRPDMSKYAAVARDIRARMEALTPLVEPVSIDEAFMDLSGTARVHGMAPAKTLARLQGGIESALGVTVSIGLSFNKFLAKIASDLDKPRGFAVIGRAEAESFLATRPVGLISGVGAATAERLRRDGIVTIGDVARLDAAILARRYGEAGLRLSRLARGIDTRPVEPMREIKSVSSETTFARDMRDPKWLEDRLWELCEKLSGRMKAKGLVGRVLTLKLKSADFRTATRRATLARPTNLAREAFAAVRPLLLAEADGRAWRLIGVGFSDLSPDGEASQPDMFEPDAARIAAQERAVDAIRARFGAAAIGAGRMLRRSRD